MLPRISARELIMTTIVQIFFCFLFKDIGIIIYNFGMIER